MKDYPGEEWQVVRVEVVPEYRLPIVGIPWSPLPRALLKHCWTESAVATGLGRWDREAPQTRD